MAAKSVTDLAIERIDRDIADLMRAKAIVINAGLASEVEADAPKPKRRGRKPKGLPPPATE